MLERFQPAKCILLKPVLNPSGGFGRLYVDGVLPHFDFPNADPNPSLLPGPPRCVWHIIICRWSLINRQ